MKCCQSHLHSQGDFDDDLGKDDFEGADSEELFSLRQRQQKGMPRLRESDEIPQAIGDPDVHVKAAEEVRKDLEQKRERALTAERIMRQEVQQNEEHERLARKFAETQRRAEAKQEAQRQHEAAAEGAKRALESQRILREQLKVAEEKAQRRAAEQQRINAEREARQVTAKKMMRASSEDEEDTKRTPPRQSHAERMAAIKKKAEIAAAQRRAELEATMHVAAPVVRSRSLSSPTATAQQHKIIG